jgi:hypothetical protein
LNLLSNAESVIQYQASGRPKAATSLLDNNALWKVLKGLANVPFMWALELIVISSPIARWKHIFR